MARFTLDEFSERKPALIYIAGNVVDAENVESLLNQKGIDYAVSVDAYVKQSLLGGTYPGLFFYVSDRDAEPCREHLAVCGFQAAVETPEP